jgi:hypothetical protein
VSTLEDTPAPITLSGSDPDGDPLDFILTVLPIGGTLHAGSQSSPAITSPGPIPGNVVVFVPDADRFGFGPGPYSTFGFKVSDGASSSEPAVVAILVGPVPDRPRATPGSVTTDASDDVVIDMGFPLRGEDAFGETPPSQLWARILGLPSHGQLSLALDDSGTTFGEPLAGSDLPAAVPHRHVRYKPDAGFSGQDTFKFEVVDGDGLASDAAVITITVGPS